jgi:hypothetical protein
MPIIPAVKALALEIFFRGMGPDHARQLSAGPWHARRDATISSYSD